MHSFHKHKLTLLQPAAMQKRFGIKRIPVIGFWCPQCGVIMTYSKRVIQRALTKGKRIRWYHRLSVWNPHV